MITVSTAVSPDWRVSYSSLLTVGQSRNGMDDGGGLTGMCVMTALASDKSGALVCFLITVKDVAQRSRMVIFTLKRMRTATETR
jgi:hypothetical protein